MSIWNLLSMSQQEISMRWPHLKRFFQAGFELDPKKHADGVLGLVSQYQRIRVEVATGEILPC